MPPVEQAEVWYSYNTGQDLFPELFQNAAGNGIGPMGGPAMVFDNSITSPFRLPRAFAGQPIFYEWTRDYAKVFELNRPHGNRFTGDIEHLFGGAASQNPNVVLDNPMDMEFGPENALYTLEYGTGYFAELPAAQLARIDYVRNGQYTPVVRASANPASGTTAPLTVQFSSAGTMDPNGDRLSYAWDFQSDGTVDSTQANPTFTYTARGVYEATLRVTDQTGRSASWQVRVTVGNQAPRVALTVVSTTPPFNFGDTVNFTVTVTDDQPVDCARVSVAYILGHESHGHPQTSTAGCTGQISVPIDTGPRRRGEPQRRVRRPIHGQPRRRRDAAAGQRRGPARTGPGRLTARSAKGAPRPRRPFRGPSTLKVRLPVRQCTGLQIPDSRKLKAPVGRGIPSTGKGSRVARPRRRRTRCQGGDGGLVRLLPLAGIAVDRPVRASFGGLARSRIQERAK